MITAKHWMIVLLLSIGAHASGILLFPDGSAVKLERNAGGASIVVGSIANSMASMVSSTKEATPVRPVEAKQVSEVKPQPAEVKTAAVKPQNPVPVKTIEPKSVTTVVSTLSTAVVPQDVLKPVPPETARIVTPREKPKRIKPVVAKKPEQRKPKKKVNSGKNSRASVKGARKKKKTTRVARRTGAGGRRIKIAGAAVRTNYKGQILARLHRYKRYPSAVRRAGKQGIVRLRFSINASGKVISSYISRSSGVPALDAEVRALIRRVSPFPPIPRGMGRRLTLNVPIDFSVR